MEIRACQCELRFAFLGGYAGQLVSGLIWLVAAVASVGRQPRTGMAFRSMFIFPLTQGLLRLLKSPAKVSAENGLWMLGSQVAFPVPINF